METRITKDDAVKLWENMLMIRKMENIIIKLDEENYIPGHYHSYTGQEACAVGMEAAILKTDAVITSYRNHGWAFVRGVDVVAFLAELTGCELGCCRGKSGSMHIYNKNFFGGQGITGAQVPLGAGIAFGFKYLGKDNICLAVYGDGAANQGQVFETFNMAKLWNLPIIFVCENNGFAAGTSVHRSSASTDYYMRGGYIPGLRVDGMDVLAVQEATRFAANFCRIGKGPLVIELITYRFHPHSNKDVQNYRTEEEVQEVQQTCDPITSFEKRIITSGLVKVEHLKEIEEKINKHLEKVVLVVKSAKETELDELYADIYADPINTRIRGVTPFTEHHHKRISQPLNL